MVNWATGGSANVRFCAAGSILMRPALLV